ncbi:MAG: UDP-N-acetylmuramoyl-L-alanyl-D-glutamate--2,6-diaminopimelate ligase [Nitrospirae bacterium]|nr:UDP-N-acetylmuramoyl-L-alanyl-D-glutamate--2,6-diaminopimelate ligase [Nitrospirota bacterium]
MKTIEIKGDLDNEIAGIAYDSRKTNAGDIFIAVKGEQFDGHDFIADAVRKGAAAVVYEKPVTRHASRVTGIRVEDSRKSLAYISNNFYGRPSEKLSVIGVTGTNGKTTTTYILKSILDVWGKDVGLIGTINYLIKDRQYVAPHTTPESLEFQALLNEMILSGCSHVVTEVSSHALAQKRVDYTNFSTAIFTNLTRDHLDFHITMEDYFKAKKRLFSELLLRDGIAVINGDDAWGRRLIEGIHTDVLTYGIEVKTDLTAVNIKDSFDGLTLDIKFKDRMYNIKSPFIGMHNVYNILSAAGAAVSLDVPWDVITEGIKRMASVKGRFEKVDLGQDFLCIVDYAHTEDALERLIYTARELIKSSEVSNTPSLTLPPRGGGQGWGGVSKLRTRSSSPRIITVFGCGGNRDRGKRPKMGAIATSLSDYVVITSDNPRNEDPLQIIKEIEEGVSRKNYIVEPDREKAISEAVKIAGTGDILLVAGKGHEDYQEIKGIRYEFSDRKILEEAIRNKL